MTASSLPLTIGYLIPEFPGQTHVLFWREIVRLRQRGLTVHVASTRRPSAPCRHAFRDEPCFHAWPPVGWMMGLPGPRGLIRQAAYALGLSEGGWRERLRTLSMLPSAWALSAWARRCRVGHLHVHSFARAAHLAALANRGGGPTYSLVLHGDLAVYGDNHAAKLTYASFAAAVSPPLRRQIEAVGTGHVLDALLPCGVDLDRFVFALRRPDETLRLITVARLDRCKGIAFTLAALARLGPAVKVRYTIVGEGPHRAEITAAIEALGLRDRVVLAGSRATEDLPALLHAHDVAILTSHGLGESTAIALREAMATGMPVIMSDVGEARSMVTPGREGLIVPQRDPEAIAAAIAWFAANRDAIPVMGRAARARAEAEFSDRIGPDRLIRALGTATSAYSANANRADSIAARTEPAR